MPRRVIVAQFNYLGNEIMRVFCYQRAGETGR